MKPFISVPSPKGSIQKDIFCFQSVQHWQVPLDKPTKGVTKLCISARSCKTGKRSRIIPNYIDHNLTLTHKFKNLHDRRRVVWIELHSVFRMPLRSELKDVITKKHATQSLRQVPRPTSTPYPPAHGDLWVNEWSNFWYTVAAGGLQLDPARVNQEWLEYSDLSPLTKM